MVEHIRTYRRNLWFGVLAFLAATVALHALSGCWGSVQLPRLPSVTEPLPGPIPGPNTFLAFSAWFTWAGVIITGIAFCLGVASSFWIAGGPIGAFLFLAKPILRFAGWCGVGSILFGLGLHFIGDHPALAAMAVLIAGLGWYLHGRPKLGGRIRDWLVGLFPARKPAPVTPTPTPTPAGAK
jgi:hypothetical protein